MSNQDSSSTWYPYFADSGDKDFMEMFGDRRCSFDDLFELMRQGSGSGSGSSMEMQTSLIQRSLPPEMPPEPPSDNEMATWLKAIVHGEEIIAGQNQPCGDCLNGQVAAPVKEPSETMLPSTEGRFSSLETSSNSSEKTKATTSARSHRSETHNLTEKRRRQKVNEKLKTLQQLVPGCHKSNQASTLDRTIQYMKSLQQQIQAMSCGCGMKPTSATFYAVVQPQYLPPLPAVAAGLAMPLATAPGMLVRGQVRQAVPPAIVPAAPMLPLVRQPVVMMMNTPYPNVAPQPDRESRRKNN